MSDTHSIAFLSIVSEQGMLPYETVKLLSEEMARRDVDALSLVVQRGLLSPVQVEIVETLRQPKDAIPGYEIESVIGHGGMGVVYRAKQLNLNRTVALKTVLVSQSANPTMLSRFEQEAKTVASLIHPHIVAAYDFGRHQGRLYFAMEYVEGEDAEHFSSRQNPLSERIAWGLIRQAASGLSHASDMGVVHRDIKPANLLLVTPPKGYPIPPGMPMVKIADFGLAFLATEADERTKLTAEQTTVGSPHYMAPEQLIAGTLVDQRADIYSLGATCYHLLAGRPPFDAMTLPQIIASKLSGLPPELPASRSDVSPEGVELIRLMMTRDSSQRIGSYVELLRAIDLLPVMIAAESATLDFRKAKMKSNFSVSAVTGQTKVLSTASTPVTSNVSRSRSIAAGIALVAALVVAGFIYWLGLIDQNTTEDRNAFRTLASGLTLTETGRVFELFDGKSLRYWMPQNGQWQVGADAEGGTVISGTDGEMLRALVIRSEEGLSFAPLNYRLLITVELNEARKVELQFGIDSTGRRNVLQLTPTQVSCGRRANRGSPFESLGVVQPFEIGTRQLHELKLERQAVEWRAFVDGKLIGAISLGEGELPEFRIVAESGPAWFADTVLEELRSIKD